MSEPRTGTERRWPGPPLALQIAGLLLGGLVVAQLVTLFLTLMLPPEPEPEYRMADIAAALRGAEVHPQGGRALVRTVQAQPPGEGPGWLVSAQSQHDLAKMMGTRDGDVRLLFYTPLPFAGAVAPMNRPRDTAMLDSRRPTKLAQMFDVSKLAPPTMPPQMPPRQGVLPSNIPPPDVARPGRAMPGVPLPADGRGARLDQTMPSATRARPPQGGMPRGIDSLPPGAVVMEGELPLGPGRQSGRSFGSATSTGEASAASQAGQFGAQQGATQGTPSFSAGALPPSGGSQQSLPSLPFPRVPPVQPVLAAQTLTVQDDAAVPVAPASRRVVAEPVFTQPGPSTDAATASAPAMPQPQAAPAIAPTATAPAAFDGPPPAPRVKRGLFGLAPVPFVQGDFVAAVRLPGGRWAVVQPTPEPFPNSWQRRVLLWFALSFAIVAPLGLLFARRLVKPLEGFADAAEKLGRDPRAPVMTLAGPAEIGRAAQAFNQMQGRLRRFVDDRTAMVGAISHDLRTPLTRMRFRLEEAPDRVREGMLEEVAQMEEMITSVLHFIRDASEPNSRETMDMRSILASVVDGATLTGGDVTLEPGVSALVDIDALGMKRVLSNLVDNALKYGDAARIRLFKDGDDAVAEVVDEGPGLPEDELERVFQPFYRGPAARSSSKTGIGLGLAACRSITRAHGGDVSLRRSEDGLVAQVRLPLAEVA